MSRNEETGVIGRDFLNVRVSRPIDNSSVTDGYGAVVEGAKFNPLMEDPPSLGTRQRMRQTVRSLERGPSDSGARWTVRKRYLPASNPDRRPCLRARVSD